MAKVYESTCKDCSANFFYSEAAFQTDSAKGLSAPERCPDCRLKNKSYIKSVGAAYWDAPIETDNSKRCWGQYGLGKLVREREEPKAIEYQSVPIDQPPPQFQIIAQVTEKLISNLEDPNGTQVSILVGPTGTGKSTWAPYRILRSKLGERGRVCVTQPRTVTLRSQKKSGAKQMRKSNHTLIEGAEEEEEGVELEADAEVYDVDDTTTPGYIAKHLLRAPGVGAGHEIGFKFRGVATQQDHYTKLLFITDGILINWLISGEIGQFSVLIIDEAHEQSANMELIFAILKYKLPLYPHLKVVIASATVDVERFAGYFGNGDPERIFVAEPDAAFSNTNHVIHDRWPEGAEGYAAAISLKPLTSDDGRELERIPELVKSVVQSIRQVSDFTNLGIPKGDIIAFVPTIKLAEQTRKAVESLRITGLRPFVCHAQMEASEHRSLKQSDAVAAQAFERGEVTPYQRVIIATNYAETSVTFNNLRYVIDTGYILEPVWDTESSSFQYNPVWHSQAGCTQRKGRVGRKQAGECFRLYTKEVHDEFKAHPVPEIARAPLDMFLLKAKAAGIESLDEFEWLGRPATSATEIQRATTALSSRAVIDQDGDITKRGVELQRIETSTVDLSLFMSESDAFGCSLEVATFLAMIGQSGSFLARGEEGLLGFARIRQGCLDDLEFYLRLFHLWSVQESAKAWAKEMGLEHSWLETAKQSRDRNLQQFSRKTHTDMRDRELDLDRLHRVRLVLAKCMREWICVRTETGEFRPLDVAGAGTNLPIEVDRDSCCVSDSQLDAFVCVERSQTKKKDRLFARHIVQVRRDWVPHLKEGSPVALALMLKESLSEQVALGARERITAAIPPLPDPDAFPKDTVVQAVIVRPQGTESGQSQAMWLAEDGKTGMPLLVETGRSLLQSGVMISVVVERTEEHPPRIYASQKRMFDSIKKGDAVNQAKIMQLLERDGRVDAIRIEITPGITALLRERDIPNTERMELLSPHAIGKFVPIVVASNDSSGIAVVHESVHQARNKDWHVGERVEGTVVGFARNKQNGYVTGVEFEVASGIRAFLPKSKLGQMSEKRLSAYSVNSVHSMLIEEVSQDGERLSIRLLPAWPRVVVGGQYLGYVVHIASNNYGPTLAIVEITPGVARGEGTKGTLFWKQIGQNRLARLSVGEEVRVRVIGLSRGKGDSQYELDLL